MELKLTKQPLFISELLIDTTVEQPVECDALLPDYCPDIIRILKCTVQPTVTGRRVSGQKLELDGMTVLTVYYTSGSEGIFKAEYKVPFTRMLELRGECGVCAVSVQTRPGYVNCRAVNPRRLDIRGAVTLTAFVLGSREEQAVCGSEGTGLELREECFQATRLLGQKSQELRMNETLELTYGKPAIREIVRCCAVPKTLECRAEPGRAVIKGELGIHLLYQHASGCDQMDFTLPTAAVIELEGVDEHCTLAVTQELLYCSAEPAADRDGENRTVLLEACVLVSVKAQCPYKANVCSDCYCTKCQCSFRTRGYSTMALEDSIREPLTLREAMPLPENLESVVDLWCDVAGVSCRSEQGALMADARIVVSMIGKLRDGELYYFDKNLELSEKLGACPQNPTVDCRIAVTGSGYSFTANDAIEVRCELAVDCDVYAPRRCTAIDEVTLDEKKPRTDVAQPGLYLYLTGENEPVWEIAKRYNTSVRRILEENPQAEDGQAGVLIIPVL